MIRQEVAAACFRSRPRRPPQPKRFSVDPSPGLPPSIRPRRSPRTCPTTPTTPADFRAPPNARPSNPHRPSPLAVAISAARGFPPRRLSDAGPSALAPASVSGRRPKPLTKPAGPFAPIPFSNGSRAEALRVSTRWDACILCALVRRLMGQAGCRAARLKSQSASGWPCNRIGAVVCSLPRASLLLGAGFGLLSRGAGLGRCELGSVSQHRVHDDREAASQSDSRFAHR